MSNHEVFEDEGGAVTCPDCGKQVDYCVCDREPALCPNCESENVTWQPGEARCWDCNWRGSPYDLL